PRISTCRVLAFLGSSSSLSGSGGPGTIAFALMRDICVHTAVINKNETRQRRKSMKGMSGISWFTDRLPPWPPPTLIPAIGVNSCLRPAHEEWAMTEAAPAADAAQPRPPSITDPGG